MWCQKVQQKLNAYMDDELRPRIRLKIETHLQSCPCCREVLSHKRELAVLLKNTAVPLVPGGFADRVMAHVHERIAADKGRPEVPWNPLRWWKDVSVPTRLAAMVAVIVGLGFGIFLGQDMWQAPAMQPVANAQNRQADPVRVYNLDYLTEAPGGSLEQVFVAMVSAQNREGE